MSGGAIENSALPQSLQIAAIRKQHDAIEVEGKAATKLLEGAAEVAKSANGDPEKGRVIDIHA